MLTFYKLVAIPKLLCGSKNLFWKNKSVCKIEADLIAFL
jgi:hypothetical protein